MKKFNLFLMASLMLTVISCSSDNDEPKVEEFKIITIEIERTGEWLDYLEESIFISVTDKTVDYSKAEWGNLHDNLDGTWDFGKSVHDVKEKQVITFKQKNVNFKMFSTYQTKVDVPEEQKDEITFDTKVVFKIDGKVISEKVHEFKTHIQYLHLQYPN